MTANTGSAAPDIELHHLPTSLHFRGREIELRNLEMSDQASLLEFGRSQEEDDLLFLERDITDQDEVAAWVADSVAGNVNTIVGLDAGRVAGYATIERGRLRWTRHVAEIRVMVDKDARRLGLGHALLGLAFEAALADDVAKIVAQMTPDQSGARRLFENLGFVQDAVLAQHVRSADGNSHDLIVMRFDTGQRRICAVCGQSALTLIPLQGRELCWSCYEMEDVELGAG